MSILKDAKVYKCLQCQTQFVGKPGCKGKCPGCKAPEAYWKEV